MIGLLLGHFVNTFLVFYLDSGRIVTLPKGAKMQRLFVTNGLEEGLTGQCIFFLRCKPDVVLSQRNIHEVSTLPFNKSIRLAHMSFLQLLIK